MATPRLGKGLGRIRNFHDTRDERYTLRLSHPLTSALLPKSADVFKGADPPVRDQGGEGSCTAFATTTCREWLALKFPQYSSPFEPLSPQYQYYQERLMDGDVSEDAGSQLRTACQVACKVGFMPESRFPYQGTPFASPLLSVAPGSIKQRMAYHHATDLATIKSILASGYAALLGITVYEGIENLLPTFVMPMPAAGEPPIGGHAVCVRGFDDGMKSLLIRNSWGTAYGLSGDFWMPYEFIENYSLSQWDCAVLHLGSPWS